MLVLSLLVMIFISFTRSWSQASSGTGFVTCRLNILAFPTDKGGEGQGNVCTGHPLDRGSSNCWGEDKV